MHFRLACIQDLPQLKAMYRDIIQEMNDNRIQIWDEIYPCNLFDEDIKNKRLYVFVENDNLISAFALCDTNSGAQKVNWQDNRSKALYLDRLGVNVSYKRMGIGSRMLEKAKETAKKAGAEYLRLFVVDINKPAIHLYTKNGFTMADGVYDEFIDDDLTLHEYGFEATL